MTCYCVLLVGVSHLDSLAACSYVCGDVCRGVEVGGSQTTHYAVPTLGIQHDACVVPQALLLTQSFRDARR